MRSETRKFGRGYVRSSWYNARHVARLVAREPYQRAPYPAPTPAETLADFMARDGYVRQHTTRARCPNCATRDVTERAR